MYLEIKSLASDHKATTDGREFCSKMCSCVCSPVKHSVLGATRDCAWDNTNHESLFRCLWRQVEHLLAVDTAGCFRQPGYMCWVACVQDSKSSISVFQKKNPGISKWEQTARWVFAFIKLSVLNTQNKARKEFMLCVPSTCHRAVLSGRAGTWKMLH